MIHWCGIVATVLAAGAPAGVTWSVLEGLPDDPKWPTHQAKIVERYTEPAFALVTLPPKYSPRAVIIDRPVPFALRAEAVVTLPPGEWTVVLRSRNGARLLVDDEVVLELDPPKRSPNAHGPVPPVIEPLTAQAPPLGPGQREIETVVAWTGSPHVVRLEVLVGNDKLRPEIGSGTLVAVGRGPEPFRLLAPEPIIPFTTPVWSDYSTVAKQRQQSRDVETRWAVSAAERAYWDHRHEQARHEWAAKARPAIPPGSSSHVLDRFLEAKYPEGTVLPDVVDPLTFLRRVNLDTVGVPPTPEDIAEFLANPDRDQVIDRLLADPRWADHWVSYWQDVLGENPALLKPTLNNTGPFRIWLHSALRDNWPADRFATELIRMSGSTWYGGPAGFSVAAEIDVPMAAKATILAKAFLAADLQCARCHEAPGKSGFTQEQLFAAAALLNRKPIPVPETSTVPPPPEGGRKPAVRSRLQAGQLISPAWLLAGLAPVAIPSETITPGADPRDHLAAVITGPTNDRFPRVIVNRVFARLMGWGLVEPVDDWLDPDSRFPELLDFLAHQFVDSGYDVKSLARLILTSRAYQRPTVADPRAAGPMRFVAPARRRLTAEQLLDSLFAVAGKQFDCGELTFDAEGRQAQSSCINLGEPRRAWQLIGLSAERDRPALALPKAQPLVDLLTAYGWRESRAGSVTNRDDPTTPLQPMILANGLATARVTRLSDDSAFTAMALEDRPLSDLIERLCVQVLGRGPTATESQVLTDLLSPGYNSRRIEAPLNPPPPPLRVVSWSHHLSPLATDIKLEAERAVREGDPPTRRLDPDWRHRMEDAVWSLINSPEFVFVP